MLLGTLLILLSLEYDTNKYQVKSDYRITNHITQNIIRFLGHSRQQCRKQMLKHFQESTINQYYNLWHSVCSKQFWLNLSGFYLKFKENLSIFFSIQQISNFGSYDHSKQKGGVLRRCSIGMSDFLKFQIFSVRFSNLPAAKDSFFLTRNRKYFVITSV